MTANLGKSKNRHYCVACRRKLFRRVMLRIELPYTNTRIWVCEKCYDLYPDSITILSTEEDLYGGVQ